MMSWLESVSKACTVVHKDMSVAELSNISLPKTTQPENNGRLLYASELDQKVIVCNCSMAGRCHENIASLELLSTWDIAG